MKLLPLLALALVLAAACAPPAFASQNYPVQDYPAHCVAHGQLPDPVCTPGATNPAVTQDNIGSTICARGWARTVRPDRVWSVRMKTEAMTAYGIPESQRPVVELDHLIPLELGGSSDPRNVWPEVSDMPGAGWHNRKDVVENELNHAVCSGRISLVDAQRRLVTDWTTAGVSLR